MTEEGGRGVREFGSAPGPRAGQTSHGRAPSPATRGIRAWPACPRPETRCPESQIPPHQEPGGGMQQVVAVPPQGGALQFHLPLLTWRR